MDATGKFSQQSQLGHIFWSQQNWLGVVFRQKSFQKWTIQNWIAFASANTQISLDYEPDPSL